MGQDSGTTLRFLAHLAGGSAEVSEGSKACPSLPGNQLELDSTAFGIEVNMLLSSRASISASARAVAQMVSALFGLSIAPHTMSYACTACSQTDSFMSNLCATL